MLASLSFDKDQVNIERDELKKIIKKQIGVLIKQAITSSLRIETMSEVID